MAEHLINNPVTDKLRQLGEQWKVFQETSDAIIGVWKVDEEQAKLVDAFVFLEDTGYGVLENTAFINFRTPFVNKETYAHDLIIEFLITVGHPLAQDNLRKRGLDYKQIKIDEIKDTKAWLKVLRDFTGMLHNKEHIVPYLIPESIENNKEWLEWLDKYIQVNAGEKVVRPMLKQATQDDTLDDLIKAYPVFVEVLQTDADTYNLMSEVLEKAHEGRENELGAKFQKALVKIGEASSKLEMPKAEKLAEEALNIVKAEDWPHLQVTVLVVLANGYIGLKDYDTAIARFKEARGAALKYVEQDQYIAKQLQINAIMGEAGCHIGKKDFETAGEIYEQAAPLAQEIERPNFELEAWRMTGFCYQRVKKYDVAWDSYQKAWQAGKKMDAQMRQATTLPHVAEAMTDIRGKAQAPIKKYELDDEITQLLGENWRELIKTE